MATRIFLALACSGIGFLVYVLTEFVRESRRGRGNHHRRSSSEVRRMTAGRLVLMTPRDLHSKRSFDRPKPRGGAAALRRIGTLGLLAGISVWPKSAFGQSIDAPLASHERQELESRSVTGQNSENNAPTRQDGTSAPSPTLPQDPQWSYGGFIDAAYLLDFNHPANDLFRSRGTAYKVDEPILNMGAAYVRKTASESSRWSMELTLQGGQDPRIFGFSATAPNLPGSEWLRHLGPTDVSYLAPVGKGLTVQAGIFSSFIGYDSLYAKDNFNYTRPWGADFTPYLMMGVNAQYPLTPKLTGTVFVISGYWHLAHANNVPSSGGQLAYKPTGSVSVKQTVLFGPHQPDTGLEFWRFLWDSIAEWKTDRITAAFEYQVGSEKIALPGSPRALWMAAQLPVHWVFNKHWSATVRPEV